jgi:hypothetical protein
MPALVAVVGRKPLLSSSPNQCPGDARVCPRRKPKGARIPLDRYLRTGTPIRSQGGETVYMSATILAFPTKQPALENCSTRYSIDFSPVDKRGFVILDACVPLSLTVELMNLSTLIKTSRPFAFAVAYRLMTGRPSVST